MSLKFCIKNAFMDIMTHAKFHFSRLMLTLIFGIRASEPPPLGPGERLKRPGLIGLNSKTIFERDLPSSDSVAKSATQNLRFSETALAKSIILYSFRPLLMYCQDDGMY